jgi:hypothetical protein
LKLMPAPVIASDFFDLSRLLRDRQQHHHVFWSGALHRGHSLELAHALHHHGLSSSYLKKPLKIVPSAKMPTIAAMTNSGMVSIRILPESGSFVLERIHAPQEQAWESRAS